MKVRIAILDLYEGAVNQGMRCIFEIIREWGWKNNYSIDLDVFDVRQQCHFPDLSYDVYISSGGPGSPLESEGLAWDEGFCNWIQRTENWNNKDFNFPKKHILFICHSYQLACRYYGVANVCKRNSTAFGVFPVHLTDEGMNDPVFKGLHNPLYAVDSRDFQVIEPRYDRLRKLKGRILAIEKERPHVPYERAIMSIRFNEYFIGTQFHPEADAVGMSLYLQRDDKKRTVIENHGELKWKRMIEHLNDPDKILYTYSHVLPNFLDTAITELVEN